MLDEIKVISTTHVCLKRGKSRLLLHDQLPQPLQPGVLVGSFVPNHAVCKVTSAAVQTAPSHGRVLSPSFSGLMDFLKKRLVRLKGSRSLASFNANAVRNEKMPDVEVNIAMNAKEKTNPIVDRCFYDAKPVSKCGMR